MGIAFDPAKDESNQRKHGVSLSLAAEIDWSEVLAKPDTRRDYGEVREIGYAVVAQRLYCVVFTQRGDSMHVISLRKAHSREVQTMSKLKKGLIVPTPEEDARIQAGIDADPDTYEPSKSEVAQMKRVGRPPSADPKILLSVRYDREVVEAFKAQGPGWQSRMNEALRQWLKEHTPA